MPLPATHRRLVQTDVKMVPAPGLSFRGAKRRGNLLQPVTFSPRPTCYPTWSCEIATGAKRPRNDKFGSRFGRRGYLAICNCPWRSLSAATDAIGFHVLSPPCTSRQPCAGRGMPRPYNARLAALQHFPLSIFHEKKSRTCVREFFSQSSIQILKLPISPSGSPLRPSGPRRAAPCPSGSASPATGSSR